MVWGNAKYPFELLGEGLRCERATKPRPELTLPFPTKAIANYSAARNNKNINEARNTTTAETLNRATHTHTHSHIHTYPSISMATA